MKVAVLTFHNALNYGAVLQSLALQRCLESLGAQCEALDYRCEALERNYRAFLVREWSMKSVASAVVYLPSRLIKRARFRTFRAQHLKVSNRSYVRANVGESTQLYDYFVAGSDQVWNPDITGSDETYFLDFCDEPQKKVSYAASLGRSQSFAAHDGLYLAHLGDYRALSVREEDAQKHLEQLLERDVEWVVDPVFLLSSDEWSAIATPPTMSRPYIFVYCLHETDLYKYVERLRMLTGWSVVYVPESIKTRVYGKRLLSPTVEELLGYVQHASFVVTDSFHVLAMSIIFQRDFKVQLKRRLPELNSRVTSLLNAFGLEEQSLVEADYNGDGLPIVDYTRCAVVISDRVEASRDYIRCSLGLPVSGS